MTDIAEIIARVLITPPAAGLTGKDPFEEASRILTALQQRGFAVVPVEATSAMCEAGGRYPTQPVAGYISGVWSAMLAANPGSKPSP